MATLAGHGLITCDSHPTHDAVNLSARDVSDPVRLALSSPRSHHSHRSHLSHRTPPPPPAEKVAPSASFKMFARTNGVCVGEVPHIVGKRRTRPTNVTESRGAALLT